MLEDFRLKVFMAVTDEGSFTKAAARLGVSQPAVSQNISELERITGVRLFERLRGEVRLTEAGDIFKTHARNILRAYSAAADLFAPMAPALVRVSASEEVYSYLYDSFQRFMTIHPEIQIVRSEGEEFELSFTLSKAPKEMGGISATHNVISSIYLVCNPSASFSQTDLFERLKGFLANTI